MKITKKKVQLQLRFPFSIWSHSLLLFSHFFPPLFLSPSHLPIDKNGTHSIAFLSCYSQLYHCLFDWAIAWVYSSFEVWKNINTHISWKKKVKVNDDSKDERNKWYENVIEKKKEIWYYITNCLFESELDQN